MTRPRPITTTQLGPYRGVPHSVETMRQAARLGQAHPTVRDYAASVVRQLQPRDYISELAALYYDACRRIRYTRDPAGIEHIAHPAETLRTGIADCDDLATLQRAALGALSIGNDLQYVTVGFDANARGDNRYTHVFLRVLDPKSGRWVVLDPVAGPHTRSMLARIKHVENHWA